jgi:multiple sugar transport system substrate-binding protein
LVANNAVNKYMQWTPAWNTAFSQNNIMFYPVPSWYISFVVKANDPNSVGKYGFMTPPGGGFSWGGTSYSIPKSISPEQKKLAWTYITWVYDVHRGHRTS